MRHRALAQDFAAGGAVIGGIAIPLLVSIPPWADYTAVERDVVIDSAEGRSVATDYVLRGGIVSISAGTGLAFAGWMVGGGYRTGRWHWALLGGVGGSVVGAGIGTGLGLLTHRPWTGERKNASGEREWVLGYTIGMPPPHDGHGGRDHRGRRSCGGEVKGKPKTEVQLVLGTQRDVGGRTVTTPSFATLLRVHAVPRPAAVGTPLGGHPQGKVRRGYAITSASVSLGSGDL